MVRPPTRLCLLCARARFHLLRGGRPATTSCNGRPLSGIFSEFRSQGRAPPASHSATAICQPPFFRRAGVRPLADEPRVQRPRTPTANGLSVLVHLGRVGGAFPTRHPRGRGAARIVRLRIRGGVARPVIVASTRAALLWHWSGGRGRRNHWRQASRLAVRWTLISRPDRVTAAAAPFLAAFPPAAAAPISAPTLHAGARKPTPPTLLVPPTHRPATQRLFRRPPASRSTGLQRSARAAATHGCAVPPLANPPPYPTYEAATCHGAHVNDLAGAPCAQSETLNSNPRWPCARPCRHQEASRA